MQLSGAQRGALRDALFNAFTLATFRRMLEERTDKLYDTYAPTGEDFPEQLFQLIRRANQEGWVVQLIVKAHEAVPGNPKLAAFCGDLGLSALGEGYLTKLEAIVNTSVHYVDVHLWIGKLAELECQVCRVEIPTSRGQTIYGTGFLVAPDRVLTNYHVVEAAILGEQNANASTGMSARPDKIRCRFDYKVLSGNTVNPGSVYSLAQNWIADSSAYEPSGPENLDYALLRLQRAPGNEPVAGESGQTGAKRGFMILPANDYDFGKGTPLLVLQHPSGRPLQLAFGGEGIDELSADRSRVTYKTNTEGGSSGSPCFTQELELVALHHSGDPNFPPIPKVNEGIPLATVRRMLEKHGLRGELG